MGSVSDFLTATGLASKKTAESFDKAEKIIGAVSGMVSYVGTAISVMQALGIIDKKDALKEALDEINRQLEEIYKAIGRTAELQNKMEKMLHITDISGEVQSAVKQMVYYLGGSNNYSSDTFFKPPLDAVEILKPPKANEAFSAYWLRIYGGGIEEYDTPWTGKLTPPDISGGTVMDWRLPVAAYLDAISARIIMLEAMEPGYRQKPDYRNELIEYADKLLFLHNKILRDGFTGIRPPSRYEYVAANVIEKHSGLFPAERSDPYQYWNDADRAYGVVEVYSGTRAVKTEFPLPSSFPQLCGTYSIALTNKFDHIGEVADPYMCTYRTNCPKTLCDAYVLFRRRHMVKLYRRARSFTQLWGLIIYGKQSTIYVQWQEQCLWKSVPPFILKTLFPLMSLDTAVYR